MSFSWDDMDSMVTPAPSAWLKIENSARSLATFTRSFQVVGVFLLVVLIVRFFAVQNPDGWITVLYVVAFGLTVGIAGITATLQRFCEGTMERLRHLGTLV